MGSAPHGLGAGQCAACPGGGAAGLRADCCCCDCSAPWPTAGYLVILDYKAYADGNLFEDTTAPGGKPIVFLYGKRPLSGGMCVGTEQALATMRAGGWVWGGVEWSERGPLGCGLGEVTLGVPSRPHTLPRCRRAAARHRPAGAWVWGGRRDAAPHGARAGKVGAGATECHAGLRAVAAAGIHPSLLSACGRWFGGGSSIGIGCEQRVNERHNMISFCIHFCSNCQGDARQQAPLVSTARLAAAAASAAAARRV